MDGLDTEGQSDAAESHGLQTHYAVSLIPAPVAPKQENGTSSMSLPFVADAKIFALKGLRIEHVQQCVRSSGDRGERVRSFNATGTRHPRTRQHNRDTAGTLLRACSI